MGQNDTATQNRGGGLVYAASDATFFEIDAQAFAPARPPSTLIRNGRALRLLTPVYWAWFARKFDVLCAALDRGLIGEAVFCELLDRIAALYDAALERYGKAELEEAKKSLNAKYWSRLIRLENEEARRNRPPDTPIREIARDPEPAVEQTALAF